MKKRDITEVVGELVDRYYDRAEVVADSLDKLKDLGLRVRRPAPG